MPDVDLSDLPKGNASDEAKQSVLAIKEFISRDRMSFAHSVIDRTRVTEVSVTPKASAPSRKETIVVCELVVGEGALFLVDQRWAGQITECAQRYGERDWTFARRMCGISCRYVSTIPFPGVSVVS